MSRCLGAGENDNPIRERTGGPFHPATAAGGESFVTAGPADPENVDAENQRAPLLETQGVCCAFCNRTHAFEGFYSGRLLLLFQQSNGSDFFFCIFAITKGWRWNTLACVREEI